MASPPDYFMQDRSYKGRFLIHSSMFPHFCACSVETSRHRAGCFTRRRCFWHKVNVPVLRPANCSTSTAGLWWRLLKSRRGVKCSKAVCGAGWVIPPTHALLMLSRGEADTQPTGVTVPPPKPLSHHENGAETFGLLFTSLSFVVC